ncbi:BTAD domain-containing putative transcriptional regulator [Micromonospora inaquosa]|nr:BTAD domain-containing putative transcriptional regulator [Micromonospora inaquosa]
MGRPQQCTVLAALAVEVGRTVPADVLVERVWGQEPPERARRTLHSHITRIRRLLEMIDTRSGDPARLLLGSGGYRLDMAPDDIDLHRFRGLVKRADRRLCSEAEARGLLRQAVALWRGEPLAGLTSAWAERTRDAWTLERLDAVVAWARTELAIGDPQAVIVELNVLAYDYPLVESLAATLIQAQYAAGRTSEALDRYAAVRRQMVEALGIEPGPELQRVQQAILQGDRMGPTGPAISRDAVLAPQVRIPPRRPPHAVAGPAPRRPLVVPAQLPIDVRGFAGRDSEMAQLSDILETSQAEKQPALCVLWSAAGSGKTSLAVHWAHRVAQQFPEGQLYANLRGFEPSGVVVRPEEVTRMFLDAFQVPPQSIPVSLEAQAALYRSCVAGRRMLVVLDNARDVDQVRPLLPGTPDCLVLVTSRRALPSLVATEGAYPIAVGPLPCDEARRVLSNRLGAARVTADSAAVDRLIARCAGLPLALALVAARAATHPDLDLRTLADELDAAVGSAGAPAEAEAGRDVHVVFVWTYRTLSPAAARLFRLLALSPGPDIDELAVAHLAALDLPATRTLLNELKDAQMVSEHKLTRLSLHELLRGYAMELVHAVDSAEERSAAVRRLLTHYVTLSRRAAVLLEPHLSQEAGEGPDAGFPRITTAREAVEWFTAEHAMLLDLVRRAGDEGHDASLCSLARSLMEYFNRQGHWRDQINTQRLALDAARRLGDRRAMGQAHRGTGVAHAWLGRYDDAYTHSRSALDLSCEVGSTSDQAQAHLALARVFERQGRHREALDHDQAALMLAEIANDRLAHAVSLNNVGWSLAMLEQYEAAKDHCGRALVVLREFGDLSGQAATWDSLGYINHQLRHPAEAIECYREAIRLNRDAANRYAEADSQHHLGNTLMTMGDFAGAKECWQQAVVILDELNHPDAETVRERLTGLEQAQSGIGGRH